MNDEVNEIQKKLLNCQQEYLDYFCRKFYPKFLTSEDCLNILPNTQRFRHSILTNLYNLAMNRLMWIRTKKPIYREIYKKISQRITLWM